MRNTLYYLMVISVIALGLCGCGDAESAPDAAPSASAPSEAFSEIETEYVRVSCQEVVCKQNADVSRSQSDTGSHLGTYYKVRCWWPCTTHEGQDRQNVWMTFTRFTGECFARELTTSEDAHESYCEG